ncbi:phage portal protein [Nocardiopsis sp. HUAS JQ3]|uniref:phage portal protein n=1 Tax=Nocardiopsis sp. HUAS JQ3 TaxID=3061629 RepID=UPI0023A9F9BC|nr:phage portal protein [Nocardiopsis sp. HUAS JQ3]WDZ91155.1 phage portal protein [Nocardiopsis sp. HUAS JQ3]
MPLPDQSIPWPPQDTRRPRELYEEWAAWYIGDPEQLAAYYRGRAGHADPKTHPAQYRGGLVGAVARMWWGTPPSAGQTPARLHMPLASELVEASADLLISDPPRFTVASQSQGRLDDLVAEIGLVPRLHEAAELAAAYGGAYLRVSWDTDVSPMPLVDVITPECAAPEWRGGRLAAVTFWRVLAEDRDEVWRHLERHERGRVYHGLYVGTSERLGRALPLTDHPTTAGFARDVDAEGGIDTGAPGLCAVYWPNIRPNRLIPGSPLGRSDYATVTGPLDALDETWSSLLRDIRLAKGRLIVPRAFLESQGRGRGASFDAEAEIWTAVDSLPGADSNLGQNITPSQFAIRVEEHLRAAGELRATIIHGAGYSPSTFGDQAPGQALTATQVRAHQRRTYQTRGRKVGYARPELGALVEALLAVDLHRNPSGGAVPERPVIDWPDGIEVDAEATARTVQLLDAAGAISTWVKVETAHPDWEDTEIRAEVDRIRQDQAASAPIDPYRSLSGLAGQDPDDDQGAAAAA